MCQNSVTMNRNEYLHTHKHTHKHTYTLYISPHWNTQLSSVVMQDYMLHTHNLAWLSLTFNTNTHVYGMTHMIYNYALKH